MVSSGTRITGMSFQNWDLWVSLVTCLACSNNRAALKGLYTEIPGAIIWLCGSNVSSGNMIYFWPWLLKWRKNKWEFQEKGCKKPFCVRVSTTEAVGKKGHSNMYLLSLACQVSYKDCKYTHLAPAIIIQGPYSLVLGRISSLTQKNYWIQKT